MDEARRHVLRLGAMTAAAATLPLDALRLYASQSAAASPSAPTDNEYAALAYLTAADFTPLVGHVFTVQSQPSGRVRVVLVEVQSPPTLAQGSQTTAGAPAPIQPPFALRFKSISGQPLKQGTYVFSNNSLPSFAIFVVPSAKGAQPMYYTGQVNRSAP